ncbi:uncharacterized protein K444DRAFT_633584 [Hyaloscypha bicolor E]|uniref:Uncharacterized protein n=1 Tax=Hyaloscypha bicolor E TaxID=1095630 RepID=A0A2J6SXE0_9HELO|nr:uncharacterized protein K444DRAFT_633584 [Hyaloscypha bicolor E]PMD55442.1 hypothetical protein K444DRAFT_633584 [Hyaloscypha bicolor E]
MSQTLIVTIKTVKASDPLHSKLEIHNSVLYRPDERTERCEPYLVVPSQGLAHAVYETRADRDSQDDHSLDPPTKTDVGLNRCSTTRQAWRTAPSPGVEVDHSNRNSKIQTLGEGLAEAPLSSNKNVHSRHYSAPSLLGSISLPREIGSSARITIYLSSLTSKSDTRRSVPASSPHKFLFGTKQSPPKKGEKDMNDADEPDP